MRIPDSRIVGSALLAALLVACASGSDVAQLDARSRGEDAAESERETAASLAPLSVLADRVRDPDLARRIEAASLALIPVEAWPGELRVPLRLRIETPGAQVRFDVLLERSPGRLVLREWTKAPEGGKKPGFRLALVTGPAKTGARETLEIEPGALAALPFAPAHLLADVQRIFYPWLLGVPECRPCERSGWRGGVAVWERMGRERIVDRRLVVPELLPYGSVRVRYAQRLVFGMPALVALENGWMGYRLVFEAIDPASLAPSSPGGDSAPSTAPQDAEGASGPAAERTSPSATSGR